MFCLQATGEKSVMPLHESVVCVYLNRPLMTYLFDCRDSVTQLKIKSYYCAQPIQVENKE